mmetsp:Transcript_14985/g.34671  ORF Transcript_14985/g.34671 Transcript_14985/m.34671 type:complete len:299 (+) Transcript_14985:180-1076(+)
MLAMLPLISRWASMTWSGSTRPARRPRLYVGKRCLCGSSAGRRRWCCCTFGTTRACAATWPCRRCAGGRNGMLPMACSSSVCTAHGSTLPTVLCMSLVLSSALAFATPSSMTNMGISLRHMEQRRGSLPCLWLALMAASFRCMRAWRACLRWSTSFVTQLPSSTLTSGAGTRGCAAGRALRVPSWMLGENRPSALSQTVGWFGSHGGCRGTRACTRPRTSPWGPRMGRTRSHSSNTTEGGRGHTGSQICRGSRSGKGGSRSAGCGRPTARGSRCGRARSRAWWTRTFASGTAARGPTP